MLDSFIRLFTDPGPASFINFDFLPKYAPYFIDGTINTILLSICAVLLAILPALALALMRLSKSRILKSIAGAYIAAFRSTPLLVQMSIIYFGVFNVIRIPNITFFGFIRMNTFIPFTITLALNSSAYVAETFRAGILAVDAGQMEAARSLGLSQWQGMKLVVLPQAIKNILPSLANEIITMVKESSICATYGMMELMWAAKTTAGSTMIGVGPYVFIALIYFCINYPASKAVEAVERRMRRGDRR